MPWFGRVLFVLSTFLTAARAQNAETPSEERAPDRGLLDHLRESPNLLPDPGGRRAALEEQGLTFQLYYNAFFGANRRGGVERDQCAYSHSWDLFATADTESLGLWSGGTALMQLKQNRGRNVNRAVSALGDPIDDADFDEPLYVAQLYYEHHLERGTLRFRFGYLDYQTIMDRNEFANSEDLMFMNTFLDNDPVIPLEIGFGAAAWWKPEEWLEFTLGTAETENDIREAGWAEAFGDLDGLMAYGEMAFHVDPRNSPGAMRGNYRLGTYYDPRKRPVFGANQGRDSGSLGAYLSCDQLVLRENETDDQGLGVFGRYGWHDPDVFQVAQFWSVGFQYLGLLPGRDEDALGVAFYDAVPSTRYRNRVDREFTGEEGVEIYYRCQLTPWFALSGSTQYQHDPGGLRGTRDAVTFVLRARLRF